MCKDKFLFKFFSLTLLVVLFFYAAQGHSCENLKLIIPKTNNQTRSAILHIMNYFLPQKASLEFEGFDHSTEEKAIVLCQHLPKELRDKLEKVASEKNHSGVLSGLRKLLISQCGEELCYYKYRKLKHEKCNLPDTWEEFQKKTQYQTTWASETIDPSAVKGTKRVLYRQNNETSTCLMSVAETIQELDGKNKIREVEVILKREDQHGNQPENQNTTWDFFVYNAQGKFSVESEFSTSSGKSISAKIPYVCMTCHYDSKMKIFQPEPLSYKDQRILPLLD